MPSEIKVGKSGPNNEKIGGVPRVHYFEMQSKGRGQVLRLFFEVSDLSMKQ